MFNKVNPAFTTVLGYSKEELEGMPFLDFVHLDDLATTYHEIAKLSKGELTISFENRYRCKNGEYIILSWNTSPDPITGNLYCIARDMTLEYDQKEAIVKTSSELFAILNSTEFSVIATDLDGTIKEFNNGAEKMLGYIASEVVGKTSPAIFHVLDEVVKRAEDLTIELEEKVVPGFDVFVIKARKLGKADSHQWTYVRKDDSTFPIQLSVTPIKNSLGEITGYLGVAKDITLEKEAELNLINSNKLLDESESIAKTGSWKFDLITNDLVWSKGNYKIFEMDELPANELYNAYRKLIRPEILVNLEIAIKNSVATGEDFEFLNTIDFSDNRVKYVLTLGKVIKNEFGEIIGAQGSTQDITEKTLVEQSLINSNKLLDESQSIAKIGSWKFDLATNDLVWSKGHYNIFELEELSSDKLFTAYRERIFPEDLKILDNLNLDKLNIDEDFNISYRIILPDNSIKHILEIGKPFKDEKGKMIGLQGSIMDVTEKTLAEQKIAEKAKEINDIRSALDESSIVSITDKNGVFSFLNSNFCTISKYTKEELIGKNQKIISGNLSRNFTKKIYKTITDGNIWKGEIRNLAKDGTYYWEKTTIVPFLDEKDRINLLL